MDFWQVVGMIDKINQDYGIPLPALQPVLQQFSLVDEARLRQAAAAWGTGGTSAGIPGSLAKSLLSEEDGIESAVRTANDRWQGDAYANFTSYMDSLKATLGEVPVPAQEIGKVLENLADEFELSWLEIVGLVGGVAGVVAGVISMVIPVIGPYVGVVVGVIGLVLGIVGVLVSIISALVPRLSAMASAADQLANRIEDLIPANPGTRAPETGDWQRRTSNPIN